MNQRLQSLEHLCQEFSVDILYVFGSRATEVRDWFASTRHDLSQSASDIDIGVKPSSSAKFSVHEKVKLALALEALFGVTRVDLVSLSDADPFLAANIIRGERMFARDGHLADEYDLYILRRAGDLAPLERERMALILGEEQ